jgi:hypothetical protein
MSDHVDSTDKIIFAEVMGALAVVRRPSELLANLRCHYYDELVAPEVLFCRVRNDKKTEY